MNVYTLQRQVVRPTQAIRDALNLPVDINHVRWLIAASNHNWVVYQLRQRGWPDMPTTQTGIHLTGGGDVTTLVGAGLLVEASVLVTPENILGSGPVAVLENGGVLRRLGILDRELTSVRYIPTTEEGGES
ncbi:hypothetical protein V6W11_28030 [Micromonospora profundi]|uniref:hypothetical protein n=1 Tax=Micromonospora profundi TaxID=1420889 RepID=UPI002FF3179E